ncbi:MAG: von Willebrand factor type A domain-containing protein [Planctomycetaceae bacterium]
MTSDHAPGTGGLDDRLTAHALGEGTAEDRAAVERLLATDDPAAREVAALRTIAAGLKSAAGDDLPARSPALRRAVLAAAARGDAPPPRRAGRGRLAWIVAGLTAVAAAAFVAILPTFMLDAAPRQLARREERRPTAESARVGEPVLTAPKSEARDATVIDEKVGADVSARSAPATPLPTLAASPVPQPAVVDRLAGRWDLQSRRTARLEEPQSDTPMLAARPEPTDGNRRDLFFREADGVRGEREQLGWQVARDRERYDQFTENRFLRTADAPLSTFSIDVDTASYANVRRFLAAGRRPPRDAVRIEELVNYFRYGYPQPAGDDPFSVTVEAAECPWRRGHRLVRIGLQGRDIARDARPAGNLVFLVDVSGSMGDPDKLPLVKQALLMLVDELTENDRVAIVTYAGDAGLKLPPTSGDQKAAIRAAIESLAAGGSTHGSAGIALAYEQAAERFIPGGANRVILATDGDLNVGITDDAALVELIRGKAKGGTFLTVLGFGQGNLQDEKMEKLADNGNGVYAYVDGVREARKVLVEQLTGSTITIAKDVKIQVEFNPAVVASYRLLGYENRALAAEDFRDDTKDAGEIGAGHAVTAVYEVELVDDAMVGPDRGAEPLKYRREPAPTPAAAKGRDAAASDELLTVKLRFKEPEGDTSRLLEVPLARRGGAFDDASADLRFAAAVAAFGMLLRGSEHAGDATLPLVSRIAGAALGDDPGGYRAEFLDLVRRAESAH